MEQSQESLVFQNHRTQGKRQRGPEKFRHLIKKNNDNFTSKELAQESNNFWNTDWSSSGLSQNWKNLLQKKFFIKRKPACAFQPIPSLAL